MGALRDRMAEDLVLRRLRPTPTALSQAADCVNHNQPVKQRAREFEPYGPLTQSKP